MAKLIAAPAYGLLPLVSIPNRKCLPAVIVIKVIMLSKRQFADNMMFQSEVKINKEYISWW
jgi:hypothetical protein